MEKRKKFKAAEVKAMQVQPSGLAKAVMFADNISTNKVIKNDYSFLEDMKYVYYEQVEIKEGKFKLLQLLNPRFDEFIKVYADPNAKETSGYGSSKPEDKSYYIVKGDKTFLIKKKNYKKEYPLIFGDCKALMEMADSGEISMKFKNLAYHIAIYNEFP